MKLIIISPQGQLTPEHMLRIAIEQEVSLEDIIVVTNIEEAIKNGVSTEVLNAYFPDRNTRDDSITQLIASLSIPMDFPDIDVFEDIAEDDKAGRRRVSEHKHTQQFRAAGKQTKVNNNARAFNRIRNNFRRY